MGRPSFTHVQSIVGLVAGLTSIAGAVYSGAHYIKPAPALGELAAIVREARTDKPVRGAILEILTPDDALVTSLAPSDDGRAHYALREGAYRVRASHPQFGAETRQVQVQPGETAEVRFQLTQQTAAASLTPGAQPRGRLSPLDGAARAANQGVSAARRFFRRLGL